MQRSSKVTEDVPAPSSSSRLEGIEGLRAIAALSIVVVHVWAFSAPGGVVLADGRPLGTAISSLATGVTLFFTLSGFLLYRPFAAAIVRGEPLPRIGAYARNRVLRIVPAYWAILLACAVVLGAVYVRTAEGTLDVGRLTDPLGLLGSLLLLQNYRPGTLLEGIGPAWSLAVELVFYAVLPVLVAVAARLARRQATRNGRLRVLLLPPLLLLAVGLSGKAAAAWVWPGDPLSGYGADWHSVVERSFWAQADLFAFGMVVAVAHAQVQDGVLALPGAWRRWTAGLGLAVFLACAATMGQAEHSYLLQNTGQALGLSLLFATVVLPARRSKGIASVLRALEWRPLVGVGLVSYSLFLWHLPLIDWLQRNGLTLSGWGGLAVNLLVACAVALPLSYATYRWVERPALRRKRSTRSAPAIDRPAGPVGAGAG